MDEPSPRSSRLALAGALAATLLVGGAGFLLGRVTTEPRQVVVAPPVVAPIPTPEPEPAPSGVLGRADLIALSAAAADAAAAGSVPGKEIADASGRRFELRLPFGCDGPAREGSNAAMRWRYDERDQALRIHVSPVTWAPQDWWEAGSAPDVEAIEGFWIARPWTSSEACPLDDGRTAVPGAEPVTLPGQTLALGQIFSAKGARGGRRNGEPYETVVRVSKDELDMSRGFRLRVSGRVARAGAIDPVRCRPLASSEQRPICLINVLMDEVAIENPANGKTLATWSLGGSKAPEH